MTPSSSPDNPNPGNARAGGPSRPEVRAHASDLGGAPGGDGAAAAIDVVAIDGPSGAGKSTVARRVADRLGWRFLDTGAMYRAVALVALERGLIEDGDAWDPADPALGDAVGRAADGLSLTLGVDGSIAVDGRDVSKAIRERRVEAVVSAVAAMPLVRRRMCVLQREVASDGPVVAEGRDMATVVFPNARYQFYLDASVDVRAARRLRDFEARGRTVDVETVRAEIERRDELDSTRADGPLRRAPRAVLIDSDRLSADEVVATIVARVRKGVPTAADGAVCEGSGCEGGGES